MVNYQLGKIYRIVCNETGEQYIGATCQKKLCTRLAQHVSNNKCSSKGIIERGNYEILLIESVPVDSKDQLHQRERFYIETLECVNKIIPCRTRKEHYVDKKVEILEKNKKWRQDNTEYHKNYYDENKSLILKKLRNRYQAKKQTQEHREQRREYWQSKKEIQKDSLSPTE